jgi:hypothetical protein
MDEEWDVDMYVGWFDHAIGRQLWQGWRVGSDPTHEYEYKDQGRGLTYAHTVGDYIQVGRTVSWGQGGDHGEDFILAKYQCDNITGQIVACTGEGEEISSSEELSEWPEYGWNRFYPVADTLYPVHCVVLTDQVDNSGLARQQVCP